MLPTAALGVVMWRFVEVMDIEYWVLGVEC